MLLTALWALFSGGISSTFRVPRFQDAKRVLYIQEKLEGLITVDQYSPGVE